MLDLPATRPHAAVADHDRDAGVRILIGNDFSEDVRGDRGWTGWWVQRVAWFARDGDILVLPTPADEPFLGYVTSLTGVDRATLRVVVPPADPANPGGRGALTPARLADPDFVAQVREAVGQREVTHLSALWPDAAVARLARRLGVAGAMPGFGFTDQAGGVLLNSKSAFRTIAAGAGVPLPEGAVCTSPEVAHEAILESLAGGPVIIKHDFLSGGRGNEVLTGGGRFRPIGARRVVALPEARDVRSYLAEQWEWLSASGRGRPVVERYVQDSSAYFAEFLVHDEGTVFGGTGELLSAPYAVGQIMPCQGLEPDVLDRIVEGGRQLAEAVRALGYRGVLCADAIVTPEREVLFTEYNGRVTGSTHIYGRVGRHVVGDGFGKDRLILDRVWPEEWSTTSFTVARDALAASGHAYDPARRTGVVLTNTFDGRGGVMFCIVEENLTSAWAREKALGDVFGAGR